MVGQVPPHPILKIAYDASRSEMDNVFRQEVTSRGPKEAEVLAKEVGSASEQNSNF